MQKNYTESEIACIQEALKILIRESNVDDGVALIHVGPSTEVWDEHKLTLLSEKVGDNELIDDSLHPRDAFIKLFTDIVDEYSDDLWDHLNLLSAMTHVTNTLAKKVWDIQHEMSQRDDETRQTHRDQIQHWEEVSQKQRDEIRDLRERLRLSGSTIPDNPVTLIDPTIQDLQNRVGALEQIITGNTP